MAIPLTIVLIISIIALVWMMRSQQKFVTPTAPSIKQESKKKSEGNTKVFVFGSHKERLEYLLQMINENNVMLIVWFEFDKQMLEDQLRQWGINLKAYLYNEFEASASNLTSQLVLWGHHPLLNEQYQLIAKVPQIEITGLVSLDDEFMQYFGSNKIKRLMTQLGHKEGEILENTMISKSIRMAQEDLQKKVRNPKPASSAKEWFRLNVMDYNQKIQQ